MTSHDVEPGTPSAVIDRRYSSNHAVWPTRATVSGPVIGLLQPPLGVTRSTSLGPQVFVSYWYTGVSVFNTGSTRRHASSRYSSRANRVASPSIPAPST